MDVLVDVIYHVLVRLTQVCELTSMPGQDARYLLKFTSLIDAIPPRDFRDVRLWHNIRIQPAAELRF